MDLHALLQAAGAAFAQGMLAEAEARCREALALAPGHPGALQGLGTVCLQSGRFEEAVTALRQASAAAPGNPGILDALATALAKSERLEEAVAVYARLAAAASSTAAVFVNYGRVLTGLGRGREAVAVLEKALALGAPEAGSLLAVAYKNLGRAAMGEGHFAEGAAAFQRALAVQPGYTPARYGLGDCLNNLGRTEEALAQFRTVLDADPGDGMAWLGVGDAHQAGGRLQEARAAYEKAVALAPHSAVAHRLLADCARFAGDDPRLPGLEALALREDSVPEKERPDLHFALFKAYDDLGRWEDAFGHLQTANRLKRAELVYDEAAHLGNLRRIAEVFTADFLAAHSGGDGSQRPVFIVGMPRSGTTLVEQMLASHAMAFGAGELSLLDDLARESGFPFEAAVPDWRRLGRRYLQAVTDMAGSAPRVIDKMPGNYRLIGLIRLALPKARIIHVRRDPLDTCFSCYAQNFRLLDYTYDQSELGRVWRGYDLLMAHWRGVLPPGAMLEVQYENLVADFAAEAQRIVAYCGLPWEAACLDFHKTERPVLTRSTVQVRQPLYSRSVGRAKPYASWLGPLQAAMERE